MEKLNSAAMKAGVVTGFLFPLLDIVALLVLIGPQESLQQIEPLLQMFAKNGLLNLFLGALIIAATLLGLLSAGLGAILGLTFVKVRNNFPFQSNYPNALLFGLLLFIVCSLIYLYKFRSVSYSFSVVFMVDALVFAYLFNHWTKT